jgi:hypothetical protein
MMDDKHHKITSAPNQRLRQGVLALLGIVLLFWLTTGSSSPTTTNLSSPNAVSSSFAGWKVLYVVTTLSEYDNGKRRTVRGFDRMQETLIPVVRESVESMLRLGFQVDVVLICHYEMTREQLIRDALPPSVGLQVWDMASPLGYKLEDKKKNYTQDVTRALARQHRFVIKDKFQYYDMFVNFEDDMLIPGDAIDNYIEVTQELYRLRVLAPDVPPQAQFNGDQFYGVLSKSQLKRMMPGFIRVEVLLDEKKFGAQEELDPVPITTRPTLDPQPCCHLYNSRTVNANRPASPLSDQMVLWETNIRALGVRKMPLQRKPFLNWVLFQRGPRFTERNLTIGDYWSGHDGYFRNGVEITDRIRPDTKSFEHINNQGGWMATRHQIWEWHTQICPGGFLPPYESPDYNLDGLDMRNVEYWSGGIGLFTKEHGCNLQRIIPLDEGRFARSLLYHTANNKQRQLHGRRQMFVKVNDLLGQLNTVRMNAEAKMRRRVSAMNDALHHIV